MPPFFLILLLAGFPALSTDMYLPALPMLQSLWGLSLAETNLSLVIFFATFSFFYSFMAHFQTALAENQF